MTTQSLVFENYIEYERFRQRELVPLYPQECRDCTLVALETHGLTDLVDNREISSDEAREKAQERSKEIGAHCIYGYSKSDGCSLDVLCRQK